MELLVKQRGNSMLMALAGLLLLIVMAVLFMNYQSKQKIQQISAANANLAPPVDTTHPQPTGSEASSTADSPALTNSYSPPIQDSQAAQQNSKYAPGVMDRNIKHMNQYNKELVVYSNRQNELLDEWNVLRQKSYGQDRLRIRDTLEQMVAVYDRLDRLATPECKRKEKYQWMSQIKESIDRINVSDSGPIVSFSPDPTPDVVAYDCFASMPTQK